MADGDSMPNEFLTGIRNLRSSFLSGAMLIASTYILFSGRIQSSFELSSPASKILQLHENMPLLIAALAAYLVGSLYVTALEGIVDYVHRKRLSLEVADPRTGLTRFFTEAFSPLSPASAKRLKFEAERYLRTNQGSDKAITDIELTNFIQTVFSDILWMEGKLAGTNLRDIYAEYRAEGEFRLSIGLLFPIVAYSFAYSTNLSYFWMTMLMLFVCVISIQTCNYGLYYFRRAHSFLAHHVSDGNLRTPSMETLKRTTG